MPPKVLRTSRVVVLPAVRPGSNGTAGMANARCMLRFVRSVALRPKFRSNPAVKNQYIAGIAFKPGKILANK